MKQVKDNDSREPRSRSTLWWDAIETTLWVAAALCLLPFIATTAARPMLSHLAAPSGSLPGEPAVSQQASLQAGTSLAAGGHADWSRERRNFFEKLRSNLSPDTSGVLMLPSQNVRIPIFSGANEMSMTLGAGHLENTAPLNGEGNIALTAHRDGSFRILQDIRAGDPLLLEVDGQHRRFIVTDLEVVTPDRVDVLDPTPVTTLTLITCHPFYFVGSAPNRYIVRAELDPSPIPVVDSNSGDSAVPETAQLQPRQTLTER